MNLRLELFLAWRYLKPKRNMLSIITSLSILGVALGVAVLIIVMSVMGGLSKDIKKQLLDYTPHGELKPIKSREVITHPKALLDAIKKEAPLAYPIIQHPVLIQHQKHFIPKLLLGINPDRTMKTVDISKHIVSGEYSLNPTEIIISARIANQLFVEVGDTILIHSPKRLAQMVKRNSKGEYKAAKNRNLYLPSEFTISGLYSFNKKEFDDHFIFVSKDDAADLFLMNWDDATSIYLWFKDPFNMEKASRKIREILSKKAPNIQLITWQDAQKQFIEVLAVEKTMMTFLLLFIIVVAAFSITNTLIVLGMQKTRDIGILFAIGSTAKSAMRIFLFQAIFVGVIGTSLGLTSGILITLYRNEIMKTVFQIIGDSQSFSFLARLPAVIELNDLLFISFISVILCFLGGILPAYVVSKRPAAEALRYE
jgi:lipoprotein-releasing system permease protein